LLSLPPCIFFLELRPSHPTEGSFLATKQEDFCCCCCIANFFCVVVLLLLCVRVEYGSMFGLYDCLQRMRPGVCVCLVGRRWSAILPSVDVGSIYIYL